MTDKIHLICPECGSSNIVADAFATWNYTKQSWELSATLDGRNCNDCGEEIEPIEESLA